MRKPHDDEQLLTNSFSSKAQIAVAGNEIELYRLDALVKTRPEWWRGYVTSSGSS
jgi:hypothetical protein